MGRAMNHGAATLDRSSDLIHTASSSTKVHNGDLGQQRNVLEPFADPLETTQPSAPSGGALETFRNTWMTKTPTSQTVTNSSAPTKSRGFLGRFRGGPSQKEIELEQQRQRQEDLLKEQLKALSMENELQELELERQKQEALVQETMKKRQEEEAREVERLRQEQVKKEEEAKQEAEELERERQAEIEKEEKTEAGRLEQQRQQEEAGRRRAREEADKLERIRQEHIARIEKERKLSKHAMDAQNVTPLRSCEQQIDDEESPVRDKRPLDKVDPIPSSNEPSDSRLVLSPEKPSRRRAFSRPKSRSAGSYNQTKSSSSGQGQQDTRRRSNAKRPLSRRRARAAKDPKGEIGADRQSGTTQVKTDGDESISKPFEPALKVTDDLEKPIPKTSVDELLSPVPVVSRTSSKSSELSAHLASERKKKERRKHNKHGDEISLGTLETLLEKSKAQIKSKGHRKERHRLDVLQPRSRIKEERPWGDTIEMSNKTSVETEKNQEKAEQALLPDPNNEMFNRSAFNFSVEVKDSEETHRGTDAVKDDLAGSEDSVAATQPFIESEIQSVEADSDILPRNSNDKEAKIADFEQAWEGAELDNQFLAELKAIKAMKDLQPKKSSKNKQDKERLTLFEKDTRKRGKKGKRRKDVLSKEFREAMDTVFSSDNEEAYSATFSRHLVDAIPRGMERSRSDLESRSLSSGSSVSVSSEERESSVLQRIRDRSLQAQQSSDDQTHHSRKTSRSYRSATNSLRSNTSRSAGRSSRRRPPGLSSPPSRRRNFSSDSSARSIYSKRSVSSGRSSRRNTSTGPSRRRSTSQSRQAQSALSSVESRGRGSSGQSSRARSLSRDGWSRRLSKNSRSHDQSIQRSRSSPIGHRRTLSRGQIKQSRSFAMVGSATSRAESRFTVTSLKSARSWHADMRNLDPAEFYAREIERVRNKEFSTDKIQKEMHDLRSTKSASTPSRPIPAPQSRCPSSKLANHKSRPAAANGTNMEAPFQSDFSVRMSKVGQALLGDSSLQSSMFSNFDSLAKGVGASKELDSIQAQLFPRLGDPEEMSFQATTSVASWLDDGKSLKSSTSSRKRGLFGRRPKIARPKDLLARLKLSRDRNKQQTTISPDAVAYEDDIARSGLLN